MKNIYEIFSSARSKYKENPFMIYNDIEISYDEMDRKINNLHYALVNKGFSKGDMISIIMPNRPEWLICYYAIQKLGGIVVPIFWENQPGEIENIVKLAGVKSIIFDASLHEKAKYINERIENLNLFTLGEIDFLPNCNIEALIEQGENELPPADVGLEDAAVLCYTSGTTSLSKGVLITHSNEVWCGQACKGFWHIEPDDRMMIAMPLAFLYGLSIQQLSSVTAGATIILLDRFSPKKLMENAEKHKATIYMGVPTMYTMMLNFADRAKYDISSIRTCVTAGAALTQSLFDKFEEEFKIKLLNYYALVEARPLIAFDIEKDILKTGSTGRCFPDVKAKIVDDEGNDLPFGVPGELVVDAPCVMKEYYKNPEMTASVKKDGWLYTGDLARIDDEGYVYIVGRKKEVIKRGGIQISATELEEKMFRHPSIAEVAVVGVPDELYGEKVKAFVVLKEGEKLSEEEFKAYCEGVMADYKVPEYVQFIDELPKGPTGKILKRKLV